MEHINGMNSGKIGLNYCMNQMFCKFGLVDNHKIITSKLIQKEIINEHCSRNSKENKGLGA